MKSSSNLRFVLCVATLLGSAPSVADETLFPPRSRTLVTAAPAECVQWVAPLPVQRAIVTLPSEARRLEGSAQLTINIRSDGQFDGLVQAVTNEAEFVRAAINSLQYWSFVPARCNGVAVATQAKLYFDFKRAASVGYASESSFH